jgi:hypothetical protein
VCACAAPCPAAAAGGTGESAKTDEDEDEDEDEDGSGAEGSKDVGDPQVDDDEPEKQPLGLAADSGSLKTDDESIVASIPLDRRLRTFPSTTTALITVTGASRM